MHPLDGARAKIERAEEHIWNLDLEIDAFVKQTPPPYKIVGQSKNEGREYAFIVSGDPIVPLRFAVLAGEVVHQLRSSLDHMLYALVIKNGGTPTNQTQFPICSTVEKFKDACARGRIKGVSTSAEKIIAAEQPYNIQTPDDTILFVLDELNIRDKHRLLVVVTAVAHLGHEIRMKPKGDVTVVGMSTPKTVEVSKEGAEIFSIRFRDPVRDFDADADFIAQIAFEKAGRVPLMPLGKVFPLMVAATKNLLAKLETEFV